MDVFLLIVGLLMLLLSGDFLVKGSVSLAGHFKVSKLVIGVVVVSFGTSAPELVVSLDAAIKGHPDIAIGNVIGSNIANIALILGFTAIILPIRVKKKAIHFDWVVMMFVSLLFYVFCLNNILQLFEGLIFIGILAAYIFYSIHKSRQYNKENPDETVAPKYNLLISFVLIIIAAFGLIYGAEFLIRGATSIATKMGVDERIISVSVVALGTSLPELATSIVAAIRKELDIFIGNIIGSNIFNILAILGLSSVVKAIDINPMVLSFDIFWMLAISLLLFIFILPIKKGIITRWKGIVFIFIYVLYIYLVFMHNN